jgi:hypothetical protein
LRRAGPVARDLLLGVLLGAPTAAQPGELDRLAREQNDPWFDAAVVEATLGASGSGDESAREQRLKDAAVAAGKHKLRGAQLRLGLYGAYLMLDQHRVADAEPLVQRALEEAQNRGLASFATAPLLERAAGYQGDSEVFTAYREEVVQEREAERHRGP